MHSLTSSNCTLSFGCTSSLRIVLNGLLATPTPNLLKILLTASEIVCYIVQCLRWPVSHWTSSSSVSLDMFKFSTQPLPWSRTLPISSTVKTTSDWSSYRRGRGLELSSTIIFLSLWHKCCIVHLLLWRFAAVLVVVVINFCLHSTGNWKPISLQGHFPDIFLYINSVEQFAARHSNCFITNHVQKPTEDSFIYSVLLYNLISSVISCTAPL